MRIVKCSETGFAGLWASFCARNKLGPVYDYSNIDFLAHASGDRFICDASCLVATDEIVLAILPMLIERGEFGNQVAGRDNFLPYRVIDWNAKKSIAECATELMQAYVNNMCAEHCVVLEKAFVDTLSVGNGVFFNALIADGYVDLSTNTAVLGLERGVDGLWPEVRKSYRSCINKGKRFARVVIIDSESNSFEKFDIFRAMYCAAAGRDVYGSDGWASLQEMIIHDKAILIIVYLEDVPIAGLFFQHSNGKVYYSLSARNLNEHKVEYGAHVGMWSAVEYYIKRSMQAIEFGEQSYFSQLGYGVTLKQRGISLFKRGFGGEVRSLHRGIRFRDESVLRKFSVQRLTQFATGGIYVWN